MTEPAKYWIAAFTLAALSLFLILPLGLLSSLLAGLLVYQLVEFGVRPLARLGILPSVARIMLLVLIVGTVVGGIGFGVVALISRMTAGPDSLVALLHKIADVLDTARSHLPAWLHDYLPYGLDEWRALASSWLRENARHLSVVGRDLGLLVAHIVVGMIIGGMVAITGGTTGRPMKPLAAAFNERVKCLIGAFRRIVFSQVRISALNTALTGLFLAFVLPAFGSPLPLVKTLIVITFIVGLLPVIGNLISNTIIFLIALSVSPFAAGGALIFLILIHKLEYFVNAHIMGTQIRSHAWELLVAMLVMEAAFGVQGLIAAPIYYSYIKDELSMKKWI